MNAAIVDRYWSWVERSASITCAAVQGPRGKVVTEEDPADSTEENDEDDGELW